MADSPISAATGKPKASTTQQKPKTSRVVRAGGKKNNTAAALRQAHSSPPLLKPKVVIQAMNINATGARRARDLDLLLQMQNEGDV
jgi:hypothetical protein